VPLDDKNLASLCHYMHGSAYIIHQKELLSSERRITVRRGKLTKDKYSLSAYPGWAGHCRSRMLLICRLSSYVNTRGLSCQAACRHARDTPFPALEAIVDRRNSDQSAHIGALAGRAGAGLRGIMRAGCLPRRAHSPRGHIPPAAPPTRGLSSAEPHPAYSRPAPTTCAPAGEPRGSHPTPPPRPR